MFAVAAMNGGGGDALGDIEEVSLTSPQIEHSQLLAALRKKEEEDEKKTNVSKNCWEVKQQQQQQQQPVVVVIEDVDATDSSVAERKKRMKKLFEPDKKASDGDTTTKGMPDCWSKSLVTSHASECGCCCLTCRICRFVNELTVVSSVSKRRSVVPLQKPTINGGGLESAVCISLERELGGGGNRY